MAAPHPALQEALRRHRAGRIEAAVPLYRQAAEAEARDPVAPRLLALALAEMKDFEGAQRWIAISRARDSGAVETLAAQGHILAQGGDSVAAREVLEEALRLQPHFAPAHRALARIALAGGDPEAAVAPLRAAAAALPGEAWPLAALGRLLAGRKLFAEAVAPLAQAAALAPRDADLHYDCGVALQESGQPAAAAEVYRRAIALAPEMARAHHNLAGAWQALGGLDQALAAFAQAYRLDPASFPRIAQDLAAGRCGQVWLRAEELRARLER